MDRTRTVLLQGLHVICRGVALVFGKTILRVKLVHLSHLLIPGNLGDDGSRLDGVVSRITFHQVMRRTSKPGGTIAVYPNKVRVIPADHRQPFASL